MRTAKNRNELFCKKKEYGYSGRREGFYFLLGLKSPLGVALKDTQRRPIRFLPLSPNFQRCSVLPSPFPGCVRADQPQKRGLRICHYSVPAPRVPEAGGKEIQVAVSLPCLKRNNSIGL